MERSLFGYIAGYISTSSVRCVTPACARKTAVSGTHHVGKPPSEGRGHRFESCRARQIHRHCRAKLGAASEMAALHLQVANQLDDS